VSGPSQADDSASDAPTRKALGTEAFAAAMPYALNKAAEYGEASREPAVGPSVAASDPAVTARTSTETTASKQTRMGDPPIGDSAADGSLDRARVDGSGRVLVRGFRFELTKVQTPAIRRRMVASLANVDAALAELVAQGLGLAEVPEPLPRASDRVVEPEVTVSPALSLFALPGDGSIRTRHVAILVADGVDGAVARRLHEELASRGAVPRYVGVRLGSVEDADGGDIEVEATLETTPSVVYDAVAVPGGDEAASSATSVTPWSSSRTPIGTRRRCWPSARRGAVRGRGDRGHAAIGRAGPGRPRARRRRRRRDRRLREGDRATPPPRARARPARGVSRSGRALSAHRV
jgi:hypothetical protein